METFLRKVWGGGFGGISGIGLVPSDHTDPQGFPLEEEYAEDFEELPEDLQSNYKYVEGASQRSRMDQVIRRAISELEKKRVGVPPQHQYVPEMENDRRFAQAQSQHSHQRSQRFQPRYQYSPQPQHHPSVAADIRMLQQLGHSQQPDPRLGGYSGTDVMYPVNPAPRSSLDGGGALRSSLDGGGPGEVYEDYPHILKGKIGRKQKIQAITIYICTLHATRMHIGTTIYCREPRVVKRRDTIARGSRLVSTVPRGTEARVLV